MILSFNYNGCRIQLFKIFSDTLDSVVQMHSHAKNGYEIHYIAGGKGVLETEKDRYDIKKDSLYVTGSNVLHKQLSSKDAPVFEISVYSLYSRAYQERRKDLLCRRRFRP